MLSNHQKVTLVLPVFNEELIIEESVKKTLDFLHANNLDWQVIISDNASTDKTKDIGQNLQTNNQSVKYLRVEQIGRGIAIKKAWQKYGGDINIYMDIDLSTDLKYLIELVNQINLGNDIAIGSRYLKASETKRKLIRQILSKIYISLTNILFHLDISDYQCGFKAVKTKVVENLLHQIKDNDWFFDTELIIQAKKSNYKVKEISIAWVEGQTSKVKIIKTSFTYLINLLRLKLRK